MQWLDLRLLTHLQQLDAQILMTAVEVDDVWPILFQLDESGKIVSRGTW
jgi:hypothetical protein